MRYISIRQPLPVVIGKSIALLLDRPVAEIDAAWADLGTRERGYRVFSLNRGDKTRQIYIPSTALAAIQRRILNRLLSAGPVSSAAYGGVPGRSHIDAARRHLGNRYLLKLDVRNAFGSTRYRFISRALRRRLKPLAWVLGVARDERAQIAAALAHLVTVTTDSDRTPQLPPGAPTSLAVFNLIWLDIDRTIQRGITRQNDAPVLYTRYVDDMVFSSQTLLDPELPTTIARCLRSFGYELNHRKQKSEALTSDSSIYGLCLEQGRLGCSGAQRRTLEKHIHTALEQANDTGLAIAQRQQARASLAGIRAYLKSVYQDRSPPSKLLFTLPSIPVSPPAQLIDELWL